MKFPEFSSLGHRAFKNKRLYANRNDFFLNKDVTLDEEWSN
jgi:hypothetical protein